MSTERQIDIIYIDFIMKLEIHNPKVSFTFICNPQIFSILIYYFVNSPFSFKRAYFNINSN